MPNMYSSFLIQVFFIVSSNFSTSKGFKTYPSAPSFITFMAFSSVGKPVMIILIILGCSSFSLWRNSVPFMPGNSMSMRAASKGSFSHALIACHPPQSQLSNHFHLGSKKASFSLQRHRQRPRSFHSIATRAPHSPLSSVHCPVRPMNMFNLAIQIWNGFRL